MSYITIRSISYNILRKYLRNIWSNFKVEVAPILVPYVKKLTRSELHAILTSGFATVAGSILALYISFGVRLLQ